MRYLLHTQYALAFVSMQAVGHAVAAAAEAGEISHPVYICDTCTTLGYVMITCNGFNTPIILYHTYGMAKSITWKTQMF